MPSAEVLAELARIAAVYAPNVRAPFSGRRAVAVVMLSDGALVPGVRVESASFPLTIPAALNAITTAVACGRSDMVALYHEGPIPASTGALVGGFGMNWNPSPGLWAVPGLDWPAPAPVIHPFVPDPERGPSGAIRAARTLAGRAHIPESNFPVGAILKTASDRWLPGVNVEHPDWASILCAERNALGTAVTFGERGHLLMALSCPKAPGASPCGGCRQLLAELVPDITVWMDQGTVAPRGMSPDELLPLAFSGDSLGN